MNRLDYLIKKRQTNPEIVRDFWAALGEIEVSNRTRAYTKNTIVKIKVDDYENQELLPPLADALVYVVNDYVVNKENPLINWDGLTLDSTNSIIKTVNGIASPTFKVILTKQELDSITSEINYDIDLSLPEQENKNEIIVSELDMKNILAETGVPFLRYEELEYSIDQVKEICVYPALQEYYTWFPRIKEQAYGHVGAGHQFRVEYPENAFFCIAYYTLGQTGLSAGSSNAFSYIMENSGFYGTGIGGGGSRFAGGVSYHKQTPGYTGAGGMQVRNVYEAMAARQGIVNKGRIEHIINEFGDDGKQYACGFTTVGGALNFKWFLFDRDFNHIPFYDQTKVRQLCTAYALRNLGMLRALVKTDVPGNLDFSIYLNRADKLEDKIIKSWEESPSSKAHAITRGGL